MLSENVLKCQYMLWVMHYSLFIFVILYNSMYKRTQYDLYEIKNIFLRFKTGIVRGLLYIQVECGALT